MTTPVPPLSSSSFAAVRPETLSIDISKATAITDDEIQNTNVQTHCLVSRKYSQLKNKTLPEIISFFQEACESIEFGVKCDQLGLREGTFVSNDYLLRRSSKRNNQQAQAQATSTTASTASRASSSLLGGGISKTGNEYSQQQHPSFAKFLKALASGTIQDDDTIGIVFHGTQEQNIEAISQHGLDPKKRSGQAYGPGEYFATNPQVSVSYCRKGYEMFVFLVVLPRTHTACTKPEPTTSSTTSTTTTSASANPYFGAYNTSTTWNNTQSGMGRQTPSNIVVVYNNNHQIPIGTLTFESVDEQVVQKAEQLRNRLSQLHQKFEDKLLVAEETKIKAAIIQNLILQNFTEASQQYLEAHVAQNILTELSRKEIAWYAEKFREQGDNGDDERFHSFFPDLPPPIQLSELQTNVIPSVEMSTKMELRARKDLDRTHTLLARKESEEKKKKQQEEKQKNKNKNNLDSKKRKESQRPIVLPVVKAKKELQSASEVLTKILHKISSNRHDEASELYMNKSSLLDGFAKRQIAECVRRNVDDGLEEILFPDLPSATAAPTVATAAASSVVGSTADDDEDSDDDSVVYIKTEKPTTSNKKPKRHDRNNNNNNVVPIPSFTMWH